MEGQVVAQMGNDNLHTRKLCGKLGVFSYEELESQITTLKQQVEEMKQSEYQMRVAKQIVRIHELGQKLTTAIEHADRLTEELEEIKSECNKYSGHKLMKHKKKQKKVKCTHSKEIRYHGGYVIICADCGKELTS